MLSNSLAEFSQRPPVDTTHFFQGVVEDNIATVGYVAGLLDAGASNVPRERWALEAADMTLVNRVPHAIQAALRFSARSHQPLSLDVLHEGHQLHTLTLEGGEPAYAVVRLNIHPGKNTLRFDPRATGARRPSAGFALRYFGL